MKKLFILLLLLISLQLFFAEWKQAAGKGGYYWHYDYQMDVVDSNRVLIFVRPITNNFDGLLLTNDRGSKKLGPLPGLKAT
ncbi:MAG: hypothetical protein HYZ10_01050 [Ignavibacteriales bacterium]|nr:hypothetical protein [Ignavibacteriales bacterium]